MTNQELAAYDARIIEATKLVDLKEALRVVYDLAAENRLEDTEGDSALQQMQFEQDCALEKVWGFILTLE